MKTNHNYLLTIAAALPACLFIGCYGNAMPVNEADPGVGMPSEVPAVDDNSPPPRGTHNVSIEEGGPAVSTTEQIGH